MSFHLYRINELYSNADGSVQFIEMTVGNANGEGHWEGHSIASTQDVTTHNFTFLTDLPSDSTANTKVLIATQGFADLGFVTPDYIVPAGFLFTDGGTVNFAGVSVVTYAQLPTDGTSIDRNGNIGIASPTNFAGVSAIVGGAGNDILIGGAGNHKLIGGTGADTFVYATGYGSDNIADFQQAEGDKIDLRDVSNVFDLDDVLALASGTTTTVINFAAGDSLTLSGVAPGSLAAGDFLFELPPTAVALTNATASVAETTSTATRIKVADINVTDDGHGSNALGLIGADAAFFEIVGTSLYLKAGTVLDFETKTSYAVAVTVDDTGVGSTPDATSATYTLAVTDVSGITITGTSSANTINGTTTVAGQPFPSNEDDTINGLGGNDIINSLGGNDTLNGGTGTDIMSGGPGDDTYIVDATGDQAKENADQGTDTVLASVTYTLGANVEKLTLTAATAINATGNALANAITGGNGNNVLAGLGGADVLDGGGGINTATYAASSAGVIVSLMAGTASGGDAAGDTLINIMNLTGSGSSDTLEGDSGNNVLVGGVGIDTVSYEHVTGGTGVMVSLALTAAQNTVGAGTDTLTTFENLTGSSFNDALTGNTGSNVLSGLDGDDTLNGGTGADTLIGGLGNDIYVVDNIGDVANETGSDGTDTVRSSITFSLSDAIHALGNIENLTLTGTAALNGTGNALANVITGTSGVNILAGLGGADTLDGDAGLDTATYVASSAGVNVSLMTGTGSGGDANGDTLLNIERLTGSNWDDTLEGNTAANVLTGGSGIDTVSYEHAAGGVTVNLATSAQSTLGAGSDTLSGFENLTGSQFNDTLTGSITANTIIGGAGNDRITGGGGADTLTGGADADTFAFAAATDSAPATPDVITDFVAGTDKIDLSLTDANAAIRGNQVFLFGDQNPSVVANSVTWFEDLPNGNTIVRADLNGNTTADLQIVLQGINLNLHGTDFIL